MWIIDGRHRFTAAREGGAKAIHAEVRLYGARGSRRTWTGKIKI
jgi:ParB-like chromosome segregation protein Spo0J